MTPEELLAAASGGSVGLGIALIIRGLWPPQPAEDDGLGVRGPVGPLLDRVRDLGRDPGGSEGGPADPFRRWRWPVAVAAGLVLWLLTGWLAAGVVGVACVVSVSAIGLAARSGMRVIERVEAVEKWARSVADVLVTGVGLGHAVAATADACPAAIQRHVSDLAARLAAGWPAEVALRAFADDLDDPDADLIAAALILGSRQCGRGPAKGLTAAADSVAEAIARRRTIEGLRTKPHSTIRVVTGAALAVLVFSSVNTTYFRPYGTPVGQVVLALLATAFLAVLYWMHSLARARPAQRLFAPVGTDPRVSDVVDEGRR